MSAHRGTEGKSVAVRGTGRFIIRTVQRSLLLAWLGPVPTQTRCNGRGSAGGGGLDPVWPRWLCTRPSGESSVQQRLRLWGHARPGPEEEGKDVGRVLVREEADPWRNF